MNKKLLKSVPFTAPQQAWIDLTKQAPDKQFYLTAQIKLIDHHKTLILDFYSASDFLEKRKPTYRVFLINKDYLTLTHKDNKIKWLTGSVYYLLGWNWHSHCIIADITSHDTICRFFHCCENPFQAIDNHQNAIKKRRHDMAHREECRLIDKQMQAVRPIPKGFMKWLEEDTLPHYIYYTYKKRKTLDGYCTHCHQDVQVTDARHNKPGICPACGKPIIYKATGRSKNIVDLVNAVYFQKTVDGFVVRYFSITKSYREHYHSPEFHLSERFREFYFKDTTLASFCFDKYKNTGKLRWCPDNGMTLFNTVIYPNSLDTALKDTPWQYCCIKQYSQHYKVVSSVYRYLRAYSKYPELEYLVKAKLFRLTDNYIDDTSLQKVNKNPSHSLIEFLKVNRCYLKRMITTDADYNECKLYQKLTALRLRLNETQLAFILEHFTQHNTDSFIELLGYTKKPIKTINYLQKNAQLEQRPIYQIASEWRDYLSICAEINYNLNLANITYPRHLKVAHDEVNALFQIKKNEAYGKQLAEMYPNIMKQYGYETDHFIIDAPKSQADLYNESAALNHCVKSYVPRIINQECIVIFLRRKSVSQKPYYTLELRQDHIVQCRTKGNKTPEEMKDQPVLDFLEEYKRTALNVDKKMAA